MPLDRIVHAEVWATQDISADLPPMVEFKAKADKIIKERYGIQVEHISATKKNGGGCSPTKICCTNGCQAESLKELQGGSRLQETLGAENLKPTKLTYEDIFYRQRQPRGGGVYQTYGFPMRTGQWCNSMLKVGALNAAKRLRVCKQMEPVLHRGTQKATAKEFLQSPSTKGGIKIVQYLGIAADEPERIERHQKREGIMLPLVMAGWDEAYCRKWCEERDLLSPIYTTATRGGCWFCHNQGVDQMRLLRKNYPNLWAILMKWDLDSPTTFKADGHTVHDYDKRFEMEDKGLIKEDEPFKWVYLEKPPTRQISIWDYLSQC